MSERAVKIQESLVFHPIIKRTLVCAEGQGCFYCESYGCFNIGVLAGACGTAWNRSLHKPS